ncbi:MAG: phosphoribosyltransferase [Acidobacteria bacterium]|nr:phosphoribosyltransferase [Acidobacteriota bacterium]
MALESIPDFAASIRDYLRRSPWRNFPDVVIHAEEAVVKKHPLYIAAKWGDITAAEELVLETVSLSSMDRVCRLVENERPFLFPVHAIETEVRNPIPTTLARILARLLDLPLEDQVIQINRVRHTGADGWHRLAFPALFDGAVKEGKYLLVDDFIGQGGTLANLKGFLEGRGAEVIGATTLTGKAYSAQLRLSDATLQGLRNKHGSDLERWWLDTFGYGFERLTESEARYLTRADNADTISARIVAARPPGDPRIP